MLHLIDTHRNHIRLIKQDICRHQYRIGKKTCVDIVRMLGRLVLELGHTAQLTHVGVAVQNPCQLCMGRYMGLIIDAVLLRIDTRRDEQGQKLSRVLPKLRRILTDGDGVHVRYTVKALVFIA